jgi:hypothetical protein
MKVQITCPVPEKNLRAGLVYDLPDDLAQELINKECGFEFAGDDIPATTFADEHPVSIKAEKPKRTSRT